MTKTKAAILTASILIPGGLLALALYTIWDRAQVRKKLNERK